MKIVLVRFTVSKMATEKKFRCRKCRTDLFYDIHVQKHLRRNDESNELCAFNFLVAPLKWMSLDEYQGKISCPKCNEKLGQYIWGGRQCMGEVGLRCGRHIAPWIHIQKAKTDESSLSGVEVHAQLPPSMTVIPAAEAPMN
uniref:protein-tyrosine-phosphatase n=1 Tax=Panagrolaimus superbus TaxID=310955 RepID=A0A914Y9R8_9BILA